MDALEKVRRHSQRQLALKNAFGVCLLRTGDANRAVNVFRDLVLASWGVCTRDDLPLAYQSNFAWALFLNNNMTGALRMLQELETRGTEPQAVQMRTAYQNWQSELGWTRRLLWKLFDITPRQLLKFDFPHGRLM